MPEALLTRETFSQDDFSLAGILDGTFGTGRMAPPARQGSLLGFKNVIRNKVSPTIASLTTVRVPVLLVHVSDVKVLSCASMYSLETL